jgi:hypothetical protein
MNISHQRNRAAAFYVKKRLRCLLVRDSYPNDLTANLHQFLDLSDSTLPIPRVGFGHRLNTYRGSSSDGNITKTDRAGYFSPDKTAIQ